MSIANRHPRTTRIAGALLALACLAVAACRSMEQVVPPVGPAMLSSAQGASAEALTRGRGIYLDACIRCHVAEAIGDYGLERWRAKILPDMSRRAKLSPQQTAELTSYVLAARETLDRVAGPTGR
ncbi:MAG: hypothetical protein NTW19_12500 [Planctomycetota bacterium]|nr:hypothetical protein [Planctomycetota bacterium]